MKLLNKVALVMVVLVTLSILPFSVSADEVNTDEFVENQVYAKTTFALSMDQKLIEDLENDKIKPFNALEVDKLKEAYSFATSSEERIGLSAQLEEYGVYVFNGFTETTESTESTSSGISTYAMIGSFPTSGSNDVTLNTPTVFYDSILKTWTVTCGGTWNNNNCYPNIGIGSKIGDPDGFGVGFTSIKNSYESSVVSAYAYIEDEFGGNRITTTNRSDGDGSKGFGFRLQDELKKVFFNRNGYVGYKWYGSCSYDADFAYYSCVATGYYIHTYSNAEISDIEFGVEGKSAGISVSISNTSKSFIAYSSDLKLVGLS